MANDNFVTFEIGKTKHIALVAHDGKKKELVEWCDKNKEILKGHFLCGTGTTSRLIAEKTGLPVKGYNSGPLGGDQQIGAKILADDYAPGFFMKHFIKDMKLALTEANMSGLCLDVLSQALANYEELAAEGNGDLGTQALMKYYEVTCCEDE